MTAQSSRPPPSIFITGAAAGIGRAVAERFAREGWVLGLWDVDEAGVQALQRDLQARYQHPAGGPLPIVAGRLDVCDAEGWASALERFAALTGGQMGVLFNNAGVAVTSPFEAAELSRHLRLIDINLKGVVNGCHAAHSLLKRTPGSRVINMCSASALYGQPELSTYAATKAAVRSLTEALNIEWARQGIRVMDVLPLFVNTAMVTDEVSRMKTTKALGVRLTADDVAATVWRLASQAPWRLPVHAYVGGQTRLFAFLSKVSPGFINRLVTARMAGY